MLRIKGNRFPRDPRAYQIAALGSLLLIGVLFRDVSLRWPQAGLALAASLASQRFWVRRLRLGQVGYLSAWITPLGLSLLVRSDNLWVHPLVATLAISSKFLVRVEGKHLFNPANLGAIVAATLLPGTWISPGQWGSDLTFVVGTVALGQAVVWRAGRSDVSWEFLGLYGLLLIGRAGWYGYGVERVLHQLSSGALLVFVFFMISDPMTTPNHPRGRWIHAGLTATLAFVWQFVFYRFNALLWALFFASMLVPLWDKVWPEKRYEWRRN